METCHENEIDALEQNGSWTLTTLPSRKQAPESKWVFSIKYKADGSIEQYNAGLIILGNIKKQISTLLIHLSQLLRW